MLSVAYESYGQPLPQVSEESHFRSSPVLCDAPRLLMAYCRFHFVYENTKLRYQFYSETCRRRYLNDARWFLSFNKMALQLTAHATQDWLHATAMTLLRSMNGNQTRQILFCLIIMCGVPCRKPITSWTCKPSTTEELQTCSMLSNHFP